MSNVLEKSGSCLCGAIHFIAKNIDVKIDVCHCQVCRKWGILKHIGEMRHRS